MNHSVSTITGKIKIKIVFLGNQAVGKSSIIQKYVHNKFQQTSHPTVGIDFLAKNVTHKTKNFRLQLWDTAGQQRFQSLIPSYLKDAQLALILFDVTNRGTFQKIQKWIQMYNQNKNGGGFIFLVGNKIDLARDRQVTTQQIQLKTKQLGIPYFQISAKTGANIQLLFANVIDVCAQNTLDAITFSLAKQANDPQKIEQQQQKNQQDKQKDNNTEKSKQNTTKTGKQNQNNFKLDNNKDKDTAKPKKNCC